MHNFAWLKKWKHYVGQVNHSIFEDTSPVFRFSSGVLKALWRLLLAFGAIPSAIAFCFLDQRRDGDLTKIWLAPFGNDWNGFLYPVFFVTNWRDFHVGCIWLYMYMWMYTIDTYKHLPTEMISSVDWWTFGWFNWWGWRVGVAPSTIRSQISE